MDNIRTVQGDVLARDLRIAIIASRFNDAIVDQLVRGAVDALLRHGASEKQIEIIRVPGAYDLPFVARRVAAAKRCDAIVALGAVIRGATPHFDYVCSQCASGLAQRRRRDRRADRVRRADHRHHRAGGRARRHQGRQQGRRRRAGRARDGQPAAPAGRLSMAKPRSERSGRARSLSRRLAMQALYQWQMTGHSFAELRNQFTKDEGYPDVDPEYFQALLQGVVEGAQRARRAARPVDRPPRRAARPGRARRAADRPRRSCGSTSTCRTAWCSTKASSSPRSSAPPMATSSSTPCSIAPRASCAPPSSRRRHGSASPATDRPLPATAGVPMPLGEFDIIARYFSRPARRGDVLLGVGDDAALLPPPPGQALVAATDTLVEGRHFLPGTPAAALGHQALAVNLSDLAAMGAEPAWCLLSLSLPGPDDAWLEAFARGPVRARRAARCRAGRRRHGRRPAGHHDRGAGIRASRRGAAAQWRAHRGCHLRVGHARRGGGRTRAAARQAPRASIRRIRACVRFLRAEPRLRTRARAARRRDGGDGRLRRAARRPAQARRGERRRCRDRARAPAARAGLQAARYESPRQPSASCCTAATTMNCCSRCRPRSRARRLDRDAHDPVSRCIASARSMAGSGVACRARRQASHRCRTGL